MIIQEKILNVVLRGKQMYTQRTASHTVCQKRRCELYTGKTYISIAMLITCSVIQHSTGQK
jgi:hypothetical protein